MADYNSSLPIRTQAPGDVVVKLADATLTTRQLTINADGSVNITDNGGSLTVDGTIDISAASLAALESITVQNGAGVAAVNIQDGGNSITVDGTVDLSASSLAALESITVQNGAGVAAVNIQDGGNSLTVDAIDLDVRDLTHASDSVKIGDGVDFLQVNTDGSINVVLSNDVPGTEILNYATSASVAANVAVNHDYTVTVAKTFIGEQIVVAGSGKIKVEVIVNLIPRFTAFNSTSNPTIIIPLLRMMKVAAGQVIRIAITNKDNQPQDVYSTLMGAETP